MSVFRPEPTHPSVMPPGDGHGPVPEPVDEKAVPRGQFCNVVLTGGVASGVVYPWAIVELARKFSFRNIGGTSVGAIAAALTAAAEYGRRQGAPAPFEVLRRTPADLGRDMPHGRTRMFSLFQPNRDGERLMRLWGDFFRGNQSGLAATVGQEGQESSYKRNVLWALKVVLRVYIRPVLLWGFVGLALALYTYAMVPTYRPVLALLLMLSFSGVAAAIGLLTAIWQDFRFGIIHNHLGLCKGSSCADPSLAKQAGPGQEPLMGLTDWLHKGIQTSAGLKVEDKPLSFHDLWTAPAYTGAPRTPCDAQSPIDQRAINLQVITTNLTHGRPYRLPLAQTKSRLFFKPEELAGYFPESVLKALVQASRPYEPQHPDTSSQVVPANMAGLLELPGAHLPLVVAARLSLSFPLLLSAVPLWAIDHERTPAQGRHPRQCLFSDGGVSSNFPIHFFEEPLPRWPTFGFWLDRKDPKRPPTPDPSGNTPEDPWDPDVWLPPNAKRGGSDIWNRFNPLAADPCQPWSKAQVEGSGTDLGYLGRAIKALYLSTMTWRDTTGFRLPHTRTQVARLYLDDNEGGLHLAMSRRQILDMAHRYGTKAGKRFVERFASDSHGAPQSHWNEHRWVHLSLLLASVRERLSGIAQSAAMTAGAQPVPQAIGQAASAAPIKDLPGSLLTSEQANSYQQLMHELRRLEQLLEQSPLNELALFPQPQLRLRAPL